MVIVKKQNLWTREELILTFNLYLKLPFGKLHKGHPEVKELSKIINRTDNAIALRLVNFASCDPYLKERGIKGMTGGIRQCQPIWDEFFNDQESLLYESEKILAQYQNKTIEEKFNLPTNNIDNILGLDKEYMTKRRINQNIFRQIVLSNYENKCAISEIDIPEMLVASHIIPWSANKDERLNPKNGICLSSLYDRAFDAGLIGFSNDYHLKFSSKLKINIGKSYYDRFFSPYDGKTLSMPKKYLPDPTFLKWHADNIFQHD